MKSKSNNNNNAFVGMINISNTCYINTFLQIMSVCKLDNLLEPMIDYIKEIEKPNSDVNMVLELYNMLMIMKENKYSRNPIKIKPYRFIKTLHAVATQKNNELFCTVGDQNDVGELLMFIFESVHNVLKRTVNTTTHITNTNLEYTNVDENDMSFIRVEDVLEHSLQSPIIHNGGHTSALLDEFGGVDIQLVLNTEKSTCNLIFNPFYILTLSIPDKAETILDCLEHYKECEEVELPGPNTRNKRKIMKVNTITKMPNIFIIMLNRSDYINNCKITTEIDGLCDQEIDFGTYLFPEIIKNQSNISTKYTLIATANHSGIHSNSGHYYAHLLDTKNNIWYNANDNNISPILNESNDSIFTDDTYMLFYKKI